MKEPVIEIRQVSIGYAGRKNQSRLVAKELDATLRQGELVCLLGPNGAGKSTLIHTLAGALPPLHGSVLIEGLPTQSFSSRDLARHLGLVLTQKVAVGMMPVEKLVALGRYPFTDWAGRLDDADKRAVDQAILNTGIGPLANRPFCELSDGEQQKVMIARALAQEPRVMVLDEPTAFLDLPRRVELMHLLVRLAHEGSRAVLMSTHELDLALRYADRLWLLRSGGPIEEGTPEDLVLRGAFASTFASSNVEFDARTGAFRSNMPLCENIVLKGNGVAGIWTSRALERVGYRVVRDEDARASVEIDEVGGEISWWVSARERTHCTSLDAVLQRLSYELGGQGEV
jgi:iron complex transport system ATP-binding protein